MKYRKLGRTGYEVSEIGHGLWGMGDWTGADEASYLDVLQESAGLGCTFFDTAWAYGQGKSDGLAGSLLRANAGRRLYVASKVPPKNARWPASATDRYEDVFPEAYVVESAERIRQALGVERIDLLQFHVWDDGWADEPAFAATVEKLKRDGIIAAFGLSLNRWEPRNGLKALRTGCVDTVQVIYNIFDQAPEDELFPLCREMNIGVIARVPLDEGSLGGGLTLETKFPAEDWRSRYFGPANLAPTVERVERLKAISASGHDAAGDGAALHPVEPGRVDDDRRDADGGAPAREPRCLRQGAVAGGSVVRAEAASMGPQGGAVGELTRRRSGSARFEILEHTADAGIVAHGATLAEAFEAAAEGMYALMVDLDGVRDAETARRDGNGRRRVPAAGALAAGAAVPDGDRRRSCSGDSTSTIDGTTLRGRAHGERLDRERHELRGDVKGVTRHLTQVEREDGGYRVRVLFDM